MDQTPGRSRFKEFFLVALRFWSGETRGRAWGLTGTVLLFVAAQTGAALAMNLWNRWFFDALDKRDAALVWSVAAWLPVLLTASALSMSALVVCRMLLQVRWREHLTRLISGWWIADQRYYRLGLLSRIKSAPEYRIAEDVRLAIEPLVEMTIGLISAFANAVGANALEFDDTHLPTIIHPSAPVAPPLFALAQTRPIPGKALLTAFALGVDVACRAGNSVYPGHYARGWHITATCGVFGSAAASAKLLALDCRQIAHALGIAASQASGIVENLPTGAKNVQIGNCARNGLFAALLAERGYTAASTAIEGERGWARVMGDEPDRAALVDELGARWELSNNTYKAYPCGIVLAPVIDACLELRRTYGLDAGAIEHVLVRGNPLLMARADRAVVPDERIAKLSIHHTAAVCFTDGAAGVAQYSEASVARPQIRSFYARVAAEADESIPAEAAVVVLALKDGRTVETRIDSACGSRERPMSDRELEAKLGDLAALGVTGFDPSRLIDAVWKLDRAADAGAVMKLASRPRQRTRSGAIAEGRPS